jgi:hypothetical protein
MPPWPAVGHDLLLGQLQLDGPARHGQGPAQRPELGEPADGRVDAARYSAVHVSLHAGVVEPGPGADDRPPHVDRCGLARRVEVDAPERRGARAVGQ